MTITTLIRIANAVRAIHTENVCGNQLPAKVRDNFITLVSFELTAAGVTHTLDQVCEVLGVRSK